MSPAEPCCPEPTPPAEEPLGDDEASRIARALGHPVRLAILRILLERDECVCGDVCAAFPLAQSTVSQHLKVLREAGLVRGQSVGTSVCYCVEPHRLAAFRAWASTLGTAPFLTASTTA